MKCIHHVRSRIRTAASLFALSALVLAAGCDRSPTEGENGHAGPSELELRDRGTNEVLAYTHGDHWDGSIVLEEGEEIAVNARFLDSDGNVIPLGGEYTVRTELVTGSDPGVVALSDHGDHVDIEALAPGSVEVNFFLWHGSHADWSAPAPLSITVVAVENGDEGDPSDVARVELYDRDTGEELAHTDGTGESMHWDGELPHLHPGDDLEVDVIFKDSQGRVITLGGDYTVNARLAEGSPDGVVVLEGHGDHVDIEALAPGEVEIIFSLWHDDHADFDAPPIELEVEVHD